jgi:murein DD-endopeptidase MepM/ murein hydrolase activator NlpD
LERRGIVRAAAATAFAGLVAACAAGAPQPAPVILNGAAPGIGGAAEMMPAPALPPSSAAARRIVVRPGQSLGGIARGYHVPARAIIAANRLTPPYKIETGQHLLIPAGAEEPVRHPVAASRSAAPIAAGSVATGHPPPEIIPLDGPAPVNPIASPAVRPSSAAPPAPGTAEEARAAGAADAPRASAALPHGGRFPWPVHGHVLAGYGVATGGSHNDGINIAAPRGAPIAAIDAGVVAYAGNELRGYGNLVLVKHAGGWISAYAHCDKLLVKRGDKVARGQEIAKVGETGGVSEPQLHFELRRGKQPVDPRQFLAPLPSAGAAPHQG